MLRIVVETLNAHGRAPTQGTPGSAGWDLYAAESKVVPKGTTTTIGTGIALEIPESWAAYIYPRSSVALNGLLVHHPPIDCDFRNEIKFIVTNMRNADFEIRIGDRLGQLIYLPVPLVRHQLGLCEPAKSKHEGFGSTGR